jgi:hypothetical protein
MKLEILIQYNISILHISCRNNVPLCLEQWKFIGPQMLWTDTQLQPFAFSLAKFGVFVNTKTGHCCPFLCNEEFRSLALMAINLIGIKSLFSELQI